MAKNEEEVSDKETEIEEIEEVIDEDAADWKERAKKLEEQAIAQRATTKTLRAQLSKFTEAVLPEKIESNKTDYAKLAYLAAEGIPQEDRQFVLDEAKTSGKELEALLQLRYLKEDLRDRKEAREAKEALPTGSKRSTGASRDSVEYHLAKGTKLSEILDAGLRRKVHIARIEGSKTKAKFASQPVV